MNMHSTIRETDEHYLKVVLRWDHATTATRVVGCRNGLQWIVQHSAGKTWQNRSFCRQRATLERLLPGHAEEIRAALPEKA